MKLKLLKTILIVVVQVIKHKIQQSRIDLKKKQVKSEPIKQLSRADLNKMN